VPRAQRDRVADLVVRGGLVMTLDAGRRVLRDASIAVVEGRIEAIAPTADIDRDWTALTVLDATGSVVTPGLVDAHVHLSHQLLRTTIPDRWPEDREHDVWLPYWRNMTPNDAYHSALLACLEMVRNGTTTFCDMSGRYTGEIQAQAAEAVGLRGVVSEVCWDRAPHPDVAIGDTAACIARLESLIARFPRHPGRRVWAAVGMSGMGRASDELVIAADELARRHGAMLYMHQSFAAADTEALTAAAGGRRPVEHLADLGVLGPHLQLVHLIRTEPSEVDLLADAGASVVHCPGASVRWGMGAARLGRFPEMIAAGINVALGSDSGNYSDFLDIGRQIYLAATIHREVRGLTPVVTAEQALEMGTINGARALDIAADVGSIEVGKRADIVVHDARRPEWHPLTDPAASFVYAAQSTGVRDVVIDGEVVLERGRFTRLDELAALAEVDHAAADLSRRMGLAIERPWPIT
jgi:5-methylthioadenosine/S-adenosylhomocysteine deaminase